MQSRPDCRSQACNGQWSCTPHCVSEPADAQARDAHAAPGPCGRTLGEGRVATLATVLESAPKVTVLEDDDIGLLPTAPGTSLGAHFPDHTALARSYSKAYDPDLRVGVIGGPAELVDGARVLRTFGTGWTSRILQDTLARLLTDEAATRLVRSSAHRYGLHGTGLAAPLAGHGVPTRNQGGLMLRVPVADKTSALVTIGATAAGRLPRGVRDTCSSAPPV